MRTPVGYRSVQKSAYTKFRKDHPSIKIPYTKWQEIIYTFNEDFRNYILETGDREKMPHGFGEFTINKKKRQHKVVNPVTGKEHMNLAVDWKKTMEKGRKVYLLNYDTEGYFFGWKWFKNTARFKNVSCWWFKPTRVSSRMLAHYIKSNKENQHLYKEWN